MIQAIFFAIQAIFFVLAFCLIIKGTIAYRGKETDDKKTSKGVAIATLVVGGSLAFLALFIPELLMLYIST